MSSIVCIVCDGKAFREIAVAKLYTGGKPIHVCERCGMVQVLARRSPADIFDAWKPTRPGDHTYRSAYAAVDARHSYVASFLQTIWWPDRPNPVLDVGSGKDGRFVKKLRKWWGWRADDYDGMAEDLIHVPSRYNTVTLNWVLENCADPGGVIEGCKHIMERDGKLVVATGSRISVPFKKPLWAYLGPGDQDLHAFRFSHNTLRALLARHGLKTVAVNSFIDCDWLVVAAISGKAEDIQYDDATAVIDFFDRWHAETARYYPREAA